jgi:hypothetical protein
MLLSFNDYDSVQPMTEVTVECKFLCLAFAKNTCNLSVASLPGQALSRFSFIFCSELATYTCKNITAVSFT